MDLFPAKAQFHTGEPVDVILETDGEPWERREQSAPRAFCGRVFPVRQVRRQHGGYCPSRRSLSLRPRYSAPRSGLCVFRRRSSAQG